MWNPVTVYLAKKLNKYTSFINTPPVDQNSAPKRKVLIIQCHPVSNSFSAAISHVIYDTLIKSKHEVRLRRLYSYGDKNECYGGKTFDGALTCTELVEYHGNNKFRESEEGMKTVSSPEIQEAVNDLRWCDSIVFVYPTWWFDFPASLKGYFDRVYLPGVAFKLPNKSTDATTDTGLIPGLTHITKVGVVTTHGATFPVTCYVGKSSLKHI